MLYDVVSIENMNFSEANGLYCMSISRFVKKLWLFEFENCQKHKIKNTFTYYQMLMRIHDVTGGGA